MQRTQVAAVLVMALAAMTGCKKKPFQASTTAYILGPQSQIFTIDASNEAQIPPNIMNASALIATRLATKQVKFCSGTLMAPAHDGEPYRVLTNHHCFAQTDGDDKALPDLLPEACVQTKVYFGFIQGHTAESSESACLKGSLHTNYQGDVALFTLTANPPEKYKPLTLWDGEDAPADRAAMIVHYPDTESSMAEPPDGGAKLPLAQATVNNCKTIGPFDINEWDLDRTLPFSMRHTCDLIHGSSGSGLIDVETGKLIGVNWGGIKISYDEGTRTDNVATKASFVAAFMTNKVDDVVNQALTERAAKQSLDASHNDASGAEATTTVGGIKVKNCGVAGRPSPGTLAGLLLLGLSPAIVCTARRRKDGVVMERAVRKVE